MKKIKEQQKELKEIKLKIKNTQDQLDEAIMRFNRKNSKEEEFLIERFKRDLSSLKKKKENLENELINI